MRPDGGDVPQGEGCEQGDPLAPALFALAQHEALRTAASQLHPEDAFMAFLDDLYVVTSPGRARAALDTTTQAVSGSHPSGQDAGDRSRDRPTPPGIAELGEAVWRGDKAPAERGVVVLGTPIGHADFVCAWTAERLHEELKLLQQLPLLPDLQCSWLLLSMCASPRANHALRTLPPSEYADAHDAAIWDTFRACIVASLRRMRSMRGPSHLCQRY